MTLLSIAADKVYSSDHRERDTKGFMVSIQVGPLVFEWWFHRRQK